MASTTACRSTPCRPMSRRSKPPDSLPPRTPAGAPARNRRSGARISHRRSAGSQDSTHPREHICRRHTIALPHSTDHSGRTFRRSASDLDSTRWQVRRSRPRISARHRSTRPRVRTSSDRTAAYRDNIRRSAHRRGPGTPTRPGSRARSSCGTTHHGMASHRGNKRSARCNYHRRTSCRRGSKAPSPRTIRRDNSGRPGCRSRGASRAAADRSSASVWDAFCLAACGAGSGVSRRPVAPSSRPRRAAASSGAAPRRSRLCRIWRPRCRAPLRPGDGRQNAGCRPHRQLFAPGHRIDDDPQSCPSFLPGISSSISGRRLGHCGLCQKQQRQHRYQQSKDNEWWEIIHFVARRLAAPVAVGFRSQVGVPLLCHQHHHYGVGSTGHCASPFSCCGFPRVVSSRLVGASSTHCRLRARVIPLSSPHLATALRGTPTACAFAPRPNTHHTHISDTFRPAHPCARLRAPRWHRDNGAQARGAEP